MGDGGGGSRVASIEAEIARLLGAHAPNAELCAATRAYEEEVGQFTSPAADVGPEDASEIESFLRRRGEILSAARQVLVADGVPPAAIERVLVRGRLVSLADPTKVLVMGRRAKEWLPLLLYLEARAQGDIDRPTEARLKAALSKMEGVLRKGRSAHSRRGSDVEDAVQSALEVAIRNVTSFRFESDFQTWLVGIGLRVIRAASRTTREEPSAAVGDAGWDADSGSRWADDDPHAQAELADAMAELRGCFLLVRRTFDGKHHDRVDAIWRSELLDGCPSDADLAKAFAVRKGVIQQTRLRLRKRTAAVHFVRERLDEDRPEDTPGDIALLDFVARRSPIAPEDTFTLRMLAALGRSVKRRPTVGRAVLSHAVVRDRLPIEAAYEAMLEVPGAEAERDSHETFAARANAWVNNAAKGEVARRTARDHSLDHALAACWCLVVLGQFGPPHVVSELLPKRCEEAGLTELAQVM